MLVKLSQGWEGLRRKGGGGGRTLSKSELPFKCMFRALVYTVAREKVGFVAE